MKIPTLIAFGFLTVTLTASGSTYGQEAVKVAAGPSVTIDGKIG